MSQFKDLDAALAARAATFDDGLDQDMGPMLPAAVADQFAGLTRDLPATPPEWWSTQLAAVVADPAKAVDLLRGLLHARMQTLGTVADEAPDWPFDPETGVPGTAAPAIGPKLTEALVRAGRGERVHPQCVWDGTTGRCDCPDHPDTCLGLRPRFADWRKDATTDPVMLFTWWARWPESPVGAAGGRNRGFSANREQRDAAMLFLVEHMTDDETRYIGDREGGGRPVTRIYRLGAERGLSERTLLRAADELGIKPKRRGIGGVQLSLWYWPEKAQATFWARGDANSEAAAEFLRAPQDSR